MKSTTQSQPAAPLDDKTWRALLLLLGDEDDAIAATVQEKIRSYGLPARRRLEAESLHDEPLVRRRVRGLLALLRREEADQRFEMFCAHHGEEFDLEQGLWLIAQTRYPDINTEAYQALLDDWAARLRQALEPYRKGDSMIAVINEFLFTDLGFKGNENNYYDPENSYFNRVLDRRTGNPISMCLVYLLLGRRLGLPIAGIGFPGHFLCRYQSSLEEYYIDAFNRGKLLSRAQCMQYLTQNGLGVREGYLVPISARRILLRTCANLHQIYLQHGNETEAGRIQRYLVTLAK
ncbi:MAG TPA: hypothetical protein DCY13_19495 [Verrucomicrobiales bacterium]|nr:hypothetical protein [Verrucomicrobiales bacterium]